MSPVAVGVISGAPAVLLAVAGLGAVAGTVLGHRGATGRPAPAVRIVKTAVPLLLLAAVVARMTTAAAGLQPTAVLIAAGLAATAFADWMLAPVDNSGTFVWGLAGFLLGYLAYGVGFLVWLGRLIGAAGTAETGGTGVFVAIPVVVALVVSLGRWQYRGLTTVPADLRVPVIAYLLVVSTLLMSGIFALLLAAVGAAAVPVAPLLLVAGGAASIYLSDSLIAANLFRRPIPNEELWIMPTYYVGQVAITIATLLLIGA